MPQRRVKAAVGIDAGRKDSQCCAAARRFGGDDVRRSWRRELSEEDRITVDRARKVQRFLSQPFFVAEVFTNKKGEYTSLEDTIRSFEELCDGKWDHLPEAAFLYVGGIQEAAEQAERLAKA